MWASLVVLLSQQLTGTTYYTLYSTNIFDRIGGKGQGKAMTLYIAVTKLISSFIGVIFVKYLWQEIQHLAWMPLRIYLLDGLSSFDHFRLPDAKLCCSLFVHVFSKR